MRKLLKSFTYVKFLPQNLLNKNFVIKNWQLIVAKYTNNFENNC